MQGFASPETLIKAPGNLLRAVCSPRAENDRARLSAAEAARAVVERKLEELSELTATPTSQLKFLPDAWAQARRQPYIIIEQPSGQLVACFFLPG